MCFSVNVNLVKEELENRYGATFLDPDSYRPSYYYHAFSFPDLPAICSGSPDKIQLFKWGLIPSWTKTSADAEEIRIKTLNARSESIRDKPSFSGSFISKRCLIPVKGFFEWQHNGREKTPWYIYHYNNDMMSLAGLYDEWTESETGKLLRTFSILTTDANNLLSEIHNSKKRMPVVLEKSTEKRWLDLSLPEIEAMELLKPIPSENFKAHTIGPLINSRTAEKNNPELIRPFSYGKLLF
jgi:putative SOS response-associated peptidase YedK